MQARSYILHTVLHTLTAKNGELKPAPLAPPSWSGLLRLSLSSPPRLSTWPAPSSKAAAGMSSGNLGNLYHWSPSDYRASGTHVTKGILLPMDLTSVSHVMREVLFSLQASPE